MEFFRLETPEVVAVAHYFPELDNDGLDAYTPHDKRPYRLEVTDKKTGMTKTETANNSCCINGFLSGQEHRILMQMRDEFYRSHGFVRTTPHGRWEMVR